MNIDAMTIDLAGGKYDHVNIDAPGVQMMGFNLPNIVFARLMNDYNRPAVPARSIAIPAACRTNSSTRSACQCSRR